jgi:hypothetical protein
VSKDQTVKERMAVIETLLNNHLHHHEIYLSYVLLPILVGVILSTGGVIFMAVKLVMAKVI